MAPIDYKRAMEEAVHNAVQDAKQRGPNTVDIQSKNLWLFWPNGMVSIPNSYTGLTTRPGAVAGIVVGVVGGVLLLLAMLILCLYHLGAADFISTRFGSERSAVTEVAREKPRHIRRRLSVGSRPESSGERTYGRRVYRRRSREPSVERERRLSPSYDGDDADEIVVDEAAPSPIVHRLSHSRQASRERSITAYRPSSAGDRRSRQSFRRDRVHRVSSRSRSSGRLRSRSVDSGDPRNQEGRRLHRSRSGPRVYDDDEEQHNQGRRSGTWVFACN
ncbi:hypothetical protein KEM54_000370 [Ascosphaera aggregata]|nr:hypothetical protein KEM54_000370 [Ascosphaera aggregata]